MHARADLPAGVWLGRRELDHVDTTSIEWTEVTWNPATGCDRISAGCDNCYALALAKRLKAMGSAKYQTDGDPRTSGLGFGVALHEGDLSLPLRWRDRSCSSTRWTDLSGGVTILICHCCSSEHMYGLLRPRHMSRALVHQLEQSRRSASPITGPHGGAMSDVTAIEWTDHRSTRGGAARGCRLPAGSAMPTGMPSGMATSVAAARAAADASEANWRRPLRWNRDAERAGIPPRCSVPRWRMCSRITRTCAPRERLWGLIEATPWLIWQLLTKRPENVAGVSARGAANGRPTSARCRRGGWGEPALCGRARSVLVSAAARARGPDSYCHANRCSGPSTCHRGSSLVPVGATAARRPSGACCTSPDVARCRR